MGHDQKNLSESAKMDQTGTITPPVAPLKAASPSLLHRVFHSWLGGVLAIGLFLLAVNLALRTVLLVRAYPQATPTAGQVARIYAVGLLFDVTTILCLLAPVVLSIALAPRRLLLSGVHRGITMVFTFLVIFLMLFDAAAEWFFWQEFSSRFNFIAVDYLVYTHELIGNIDESYPARTIICILAAVSLAGTFLARRIMLAGTRAPRPWGQRLALPGLWVGLALPILLLSRPLVARTSDNQYVNELSRNGIYSLVEAFYENELNYEQFYLTREPTMVFRRLREMVSAPGERFVSQGGQDVAREIRPEGAPGKANVILVIVESLSAEYLGVFGNTQGLTPNLDALAKDSLLLTRAYASGTRTVRGLEALSMSIPPTPGHSYVKRPDHGTVYTLTGLLAQKGYDVSFQYGGYGYFDNMNSFFSSNGCRIVDRANLKADGQLTFATIWGGCDEDLYGRVLREADGSYAAGKPFFSVVMTTSNHRPYAYPQKIDIPSGSGRSGAVKYTDYAIGELLRQARGRPWFDNTIFVIVADHCANSAGKTELPVSEYHIPVFFYAPKIISPRQYDVLCGQMDVPPTLLGMLNIPYVSKFFGKDVLRCPPNRALIGTYQKLGYYTGSTLTVLSPGEKASAYHVNPGGAQTRTDLDSALLLDAISYYQGASELLAKRRFTQD